MLPDGIEHHRKYSHKDHYTDGQHHPVQKVLLLGNARDRRVQVQLFDGWATGQVLHCMRGTGQPCCCSRTQRNQLKDTAFHISHLRLSLRDSVARLPLQCRAKSCEESKNQGAWHTAPNCPACSLQGCNANAYRDFKQDKTSLQRPLVGCRAKNDGWNRQLHARWYARCKDTKTRETDPGFAVQPVCKA